MSRISNRRPKAAAFQAILGICLTAAASGIPVPTNTSIYELRRELGWCGEGQQGRDDASCIKVFPSMFDRMWSCPILFDEAGPGFEQLRGKNPSITVKSSALRGWVHDNVLITVAEVRRVKGKGLFYSYYSNGHDQEPYQPWSSSKIFAASNAADHMRELCGHSCDGLSSLEASSMTPLGDFATIMTTYDTSQNLSSNSLASYFHDIGNRQRADDLIHEDWLRRPENESFGGNYGEQSPASLKYSFLKERERSVRRRHEKRCRVAADNSSEIIANNLSSFTMVEFLRRVLLRSEVDPEQRLRYMTEEDVHDLAYGARDSTRFPGLQWGGMSADSSVFIQRAIPDILAVDQASGGNWRIFSKLGSGLSDTRKQWENTLNGYACLPSLGGGGGREGREFLVSARTFDKVSETSSDNKMQKAIDGVLRFLLQDTLYLDKAHEGLTQVKA